MEEVISIETIIKKIFCPGCKKIKKYHAKGLCGNCYEKQRQSRKIICPECKKLIAYYSKGLCRKCYCKRYTKRNKDPKCYTRLNKSEFFAYNQLKKMGWNPQISKTETHYDDNGTPDFFCSHKRFVEIKTKDYFSFTIGQVFYWTKILEQGYELYIMIINKKCTKILDFIKINKWDIEIERINVSILYDWINYE